MGGPILKDGWELDLMREAGRIVAEGHALIREHLRPGVTTAELDRIYAEHVRARDAVPTFLGYRGYPASICASINEEVVHGIPSGKRVLREGDILSVDCGATYKGYVGDAAFTTGVGPVTPEAERLMRVTEEALDLATEAMKPDGRLSDVSRAVQRHAEASGFSIVKSFQGHGIGAKMHEAPGVPNYVIEPVDSFDLVLKPGLVLAIEPMLNIGGGGVRTLSDGWTVVTRDGSLSAHFEHCVAVTKDGPRILTLP